MQADQGNGLLAVRHTHPARVLSKRAAAKSAITGRPERKPSPQALAYSREKNLERESLAEERELSGCTERSMGAATVAEIKAEFEKKRVPAGGLIETSSRGRRAARYHGGKMSATKRGHHPRERETGQNQHPPNSQVSRHAKIEQRPLALSESQRGAVEKSVAAADPVTELEGVAGAGKTTSLDCNPGIAAERVIRWKACANVTPRGAKKLREAGIERAVAERHLARKRKRLKRRQKRLYGSRRTSLASKNKGRVTASPNSKNDRVC